MLSVAKRSVFWSGVQQVSAVFLQIAIGLVISRLILPEDFGIIALTLVFFSIAQVILDFGMEGALIQKKESTDRDYDTAFIISTVTSILFYILFFFVSEPIAEFYNVPILGKAIRISAAILIIRAVGIVPYAKLQRELRFRNIARISIFVTIISGAVAIYLAYVGYAFYSLIAQTLLSGSFMTLLYYVVSKWRPRFRFSCSSFRQLVNFGLPMMFTGLINAVYANMYSLVIGKRFSERHLGLFNRGAIYAGYIPFNLSDFTLRALYPIFAKSQDNIANLRTQAIRTLHFTAFLAIPLNLFLMANAYDIIMILLKDKWIDNVPYIQILSLANLTYIATNLHQNLLKSINRTDRLLVCEVIKKVLGVSVLIITVPMGIIAMMWGLMIFNIISILIGALFVKPLIGMTIYDHLKALLPTLAISFASVYCGYYAASVIGNIYARVLVSGIVTGIIFLGISALIKDKAIPFFMGYLRRR